MCHNKAVSLPVFSSEYGRAGHTKNSGVQGSVKEVVEKISHTVDKVMNGMKLRSMTNEEVIVTLYSVKVWRLNLPNNCYSLDLSNNMDAREKGVKQLFLSCVSVGILLEGQSLAG